MSVDIITIGKETFGAFGRNKATRLGAALAYYTFAAFFPLLLVLISLVGFALNFNVGGAQDGRAFVMETVTQQLPAAADLLEENLEETENNSGLIAFVGLLTGLWTASNIFAQLEDAFKEIFHIPPRKSSILDTLKIRAKAASIIFLLAFLMIGSLIMGAILSIVSAIMGGLPGGADWIWLLNLGTSLALTGFAFAALFKYLPDRQVTWSAALIGGMFTSITWQVGRELLTLWLGRGGGATAGNVVGSVLAFLALIYYAWQILLLGAQLTGVYDELANPEMVRADLGADVHLPTLAQVEVSASNHSTPVIAIEDPQNNISSVSSRDPSLKARDDIITGKARYINPTLPPPASLSARPKNHTRSAYSGPITFGAGFVAGVMSFFLGVRMVFNQLIGRGEQEQM